MSETLKQIYQRHSVEGDVGHGDKGGIHSYLDVYEALFEPIRHKPNVVMEIGIAQGLSIDMWLEYFPTSKIVGVDISLIVDPAKYTDGRAKLIEADATKPEFLNLIPDTFDIVIDDGSHLSADQVATFNLLKNRMKRGGLYVIEDILNIDIARKEFESIHDNVEIFDMRGKKGRFDDVLVVYRM